MMPDFRTGFGTDSHQFCQRNHQKVSRLGGVPLDFSVEANSDGDVIYHALCDALTNALGRNDLSSYADELCRQGNTDSSLYLQHALMQVKSAGWAVNNVSIVFEGVKPQIQPFRQRIRKNIATILEIDPLRVGLSAKTEEGIALIGKGKAFKAYASVLLRKT